MVKIEKHCPNIVKEKNGRQNFKIVIGHKIFNNLNFILYAIINNAINKNINIAIKIPTKIKYIKECSFNKMSKLK